ncbi:protein kinase domain-containing protein [Polyangium fumosum]|uniref:non-specific serine/threonine protein kinase n=1 Tax=Polyangium fumosum TaxID=889272 RepID=A0A4U1JD77_9BACT|nr:protein kinase [Polyangium fumosum]TKD08617.1 serine/threonine protein kinase [Polyangium fumosum]
MSTAAALIGSTLAGRFRITAFLGEGAMATVYRGVQDADPREVAVKVMHPELARDTTFAKRFRREAKAASRLNHRNTVQIIDYGVDGNVAYIAMELLQGRDLFEILSVERRLAEARAARILMEVCDVLTAAHEQGVVHRDLKPENIMILGQPDAAGRERIKVLDFGIAKILDKEPKEGEGGDAGPVSAAPSSAITTVGVIVGTPEYMSPEQCRGEAVDPRSDIYACGVLLYQLVTGQIPFSGDSIIDIALKHIRQPPPRPSHATPFMHKGLEAVILTALEKWPAQRQQSAVELKAALEKILPELRATPHRLGGTSRDDAPPPPSRRNIAEVPVESVRVAHATIPEQSTLPSEELTIKRKGLKPLASADAEHDTDPEGGRLLKDGVIIRGPADAEPVLGSSPTIPAAPSVTDTLATGREPPPGAKKPSSPKPPSVVKVVADDKARKPGAALATDKPRAASRKKKGGTSFWLLVPIAVLVGITVGAVVFFLTQ